MRRFALVAALLLAGCGSDDGGNGDADGEAAPAGSVEIIATEFAFDPADVSVDAAGETTFTLSNEGDFPHALEIEGGGVEEGTEELGPGESGSLTVDLEPGEYVLYCPVGDHRDQGMEGTLVVGGGAAAGAGGGSTTKSDSGSDDPYGYG